MNRRDFLQSGMTASTGLIVAIHLSALTGCARSSTSRGSFAPSAFVRIDESGSVTFTLGSSELGQGAHTALALLLAEELDADWSSIRVQDAPADAAYVNPATGMQMTGGSSSVTGFWLPMRRAGATARKMLVDAAANQWGVASETCRTERGEVIHEPSQRRLPYGKLVTRAAQLDSPAEVKLKDSKDFRLIGRAVQRLEAPAKVDGTARFGIDVRLPEMLTALIARPPPGATVKSFDATKARDVGGVRAVVQVDAGVAIVAEGFWPALKGRDALQVEWDEGPLAAFDSEKQAQEYRQLMQQQGVVVRNVGDTEGAMKTAGRRVEAMYELPYLAVAPMEPLNCVADVGPNHCRVWVGTQFQQLDRQAAAQAAGLELEQVELNTMLVGGGFGRRGVPDGHFVREAVQVSKAVGSPVKVVWTREDDVQGAYYRPASCHSLAAALDSAGKPTAWFHRIACQPVLIGTAFAGEEERKGIDSAAYSGSNVAFYGIPNIRTELHTVMHGPKAWAFRSVGSTHNAFVTECFIDELARAAGQDPLAYRLGLLAGQPRYTAVLELAASKAGWGQKRAERRALGLALHRFDSYVAQVADVSVAKDGAIRVHRVVCAIDCGIAVDPQNVRAQMEGGIIMGLTAALHGRITLREGRVQQSNFHDYPMLRIDETPDIEVHIIEGGPDPLGVGEAGVPPIAPAVANAIAAVGTRIRNLPLIAEDATRSGHPH